MATPDVLAIVKTPVSWAKARPFIFLFLLFVVAMLAIRYAATVLSYVNRVPVFGSRAVAFAQPTARAA